MPARTSGRTVTTRRSLHPDRGMPCHRGARRRPLCRRLQLHREQSLEQGRVPLLRPLRPGPEQNLHDDVALHRRIVAASARRGGNHVGTRWPRPCAHDWRQAVAFQDRIGEQARCAVIAVGEGVDANQPSMACSRSMKTAHPCASVIRCRWRAWRPVSSWARRVLASSRAPSSSQSAIWAGLSGCRRESCRSRPATAPAAPGKARLRPDPHHELPPRPGQSGGGHARRWGRRGGRP